MNTDKASNFINLLVRNLQVLCHSNVDFSDNVEVIGHIYLSVDKSKKFNYVVNEKVCKSDDSSTVFVSNSFHAEDQKKKEEKNSEKPGAKSDQKSRLTGEQPRHHPHHQNQFHANTKRSSNQFDHQSFSSPIQRQKRPPHFESPHNSHGSDNKRQKNTRSDHPSHVVPTEQIKQEPMSIDLTNVKEEPSDNNELSNLSFADINDTSWSQSKHQSLSEQRSHGSDDSLPVSFGGDSENYGIYPVAMYDGALGSLTSQSTSAQDVLDQQFQGISAAPSRHTAPKLSTEQREEIIRALQSEFKPSQAALAVKYGVSRQAVNSLKKRYIDSIEYQ